MKIHDPEEPRSLFKEGMERFIEPRDEHGDPIDWSGLFEAVEGICEKIDPGFKKKKRELVQMINEKYSFRGPINLMTVLMESSTRTSGGQGGWFSFEGRYLGERNK